MNTQVEVTIYTDGSCEPNPGTAGWGAVLIHHASGARREACGYIGEGTNNTAELIAAIRALELLKRPCRVRVYSDSQWLVRCATGEYGRHTHHQLWAQLEDLTQQHVIEWRWIRGHAKHPENEQAHKLANRGRTRRKI